MPDEFCPKDKVQDENRIYQKSITTLRKGITNGNMNSL